jgi:hypothetical protein
LNEEGILVECGGTELFVALKGVDGKVGAEQHEDQQREDLEGETGDHDVIACVGGLVLVGLRRRDSSSRSL